ncbi:peptidylprolyl isomerase [Chlorogloeopsis sp. ULAP01]|uniref:peptidylprolyl isomerase n=1 Tax=Chlorogloeopsis sp. ULAP01 TaxID=3056483 RepID=UPI0025AB0CA0|nr:peptidylprolyl isomerase [Chlorogloeopsis sp. ULAP01]MDM9380975.1 peptidylprolyl isomerase [Chlorogloeopsis sp. ULAP01]
MYNLPKIHISSEEIVSYLKSEMSLRQIYYKILSQKLIHYVAKERGIVVTTEEIQDEAERQRREEQLEKAADTMAWLAQQFICPDDWEVGIRNRLLAKKVAETLFSQDVENFFIQNRLEFEQVILYQIIIDCEKLAQEIYYQIEEGEISFYEAAHLYNIDENRRKKCGYEGKLYRCSLPPNITAVIFNATSQQLIGPIKTEQGYHLFMVEELISAELTSQIYEEILNNMFQKWLAAEVECLLQ